MQPASKQSATFRVNINYGNIIWHELEKKLKLSRTLREELGKVLLGVSTRNSRQDRKRLADRPAVRAIYVIAMMLMSC